MIDINFWEMLLNATTLNKSVKKHLFKQVSVLINLYNFVCNNTDPIHIKYIVDHVVSISKKFDLPQENFYINLTEWNSMIIDRETTDLLLNEYMKKVEPNLVADSLKEYMKINDTYFFSLPYFPFAEKIDRSGLIELIEYLLQSIEISLTEKYKN